MGVCVFDRDTAPSLPVLLKWHTALQSRKKLGILAQVDPADDNAEKFV